jgi:hypothetical protein
MHLDYSNDNRTAAARLARLSVLLTLLANCGWAIADAANMIVQIQNPSHPLLQPYRATDRLNQGRLMTPTRAGVITWILLSRGVIVCTLAGWAYFILRNDSALAAVLYAIASATLAVGLFYLADPPPGPRAVIPAPVNVVLRTGWMLACAAVAGWYAWLVWPTQASSANP